MGDRECVYVGGGGGGGAGGRGFHTILKGDQPRQFCLISFCGFGEKDKICSFIKIFLICITVINRQKKMFHRKTRIIC